MFGISRISHGISLALTYSSPVVRIEGGAAPLGPAVDAGKDDEALGRRRREERTAPVAAELGQHRGVRRRRARRQHLLGQVLAREGRRRGRMPLRRGRLFALDGRCGARRSSTGNSDAPVLADNFLLMFVGWEGVGLCSYLLIGYYIKRNEAREAAKKAFVMNRIGDWGVLMGIFLIFTLTGSISFFDKVVDGQEVQSVFTYVATHMSADPFTWGAIVAGGLTTVGVLLFIGATGKSAQIPLLTWLPDAMAGPTPVSALIHAATMVTAGVYLVVRANAIYQFAPTAMWIIAVVGAATALFAATIAIAQNDIKKVLAYSTVSQLGFMFLAAGVGAFTRRSFT